MLFSETLVALLQNGEIQQAIRAAERIHQSGEQALKEVRLLVHEGQAHFIENYADLIQAIENRFDMVERRTGVQADFSYDLSALESLPTQWMENIFWIILEGLNNSLKHAKASRIHVSIVDEGHQITIEIKDDGAGFNSNQVRGGGVGMKSMNERAEMLGGKLSIESALGIGTKVKCTLEIPKK
jgi:signal transduction histidine kinase